MPIRYEVDEQQRLVVTVVKGVVTADDFISALEEVWADKAIAAFDELIDLREMDPSTISPESVKDVAERATELFGRRTDYRTAILAETDMQYGMARMYEVLRERHEERFRVFRIRAEALAWLGVS